MRKLAICRAVLVAAVCLHCLTYFHLTNEDAWISFKYARNLADGLGLVSNPGERQEGYSNLLLVVLLAGGRWAFGWDIVLTAKVIGIVATLACAAMMSCLARRVVRVALLPAAPGATAPAVAGDRAIIADVAALVVFAAIGASRYVVWWATSGLETMLYSAFVSAVVLLTLRVVCDGHVRALPVLALVAWLSAQVRPEGLSNIAMVLGLVTAWWLTTPGARRAAVRPGIVSLATLVVLTVGFVGFKLFYFGDLMSNPAHVKLALRQWFDPWDYLRRYGEDKGAVFVLLMGLAVVAGVFAAAGSTVRARRVSPLAWHLLVLLAAIATQLCFVWYSGGDYMEYGRFVVTHYPAAVVLLVTSPVSLLAAMGVAPSRWAVVVALAVVGAAVVSSAVTEPVARASWWSSDFVDPRRYHVERNTSYARAAAEIDRLAGSEGGYFATGEFGYVPYHVRAPGIDMMGLNQSQIARNFAGYELGQAVAANRDFVLSKLPRVIAGIQYHRDAKGELSMPPAVAWYLGPYFESAFFLRNYDTDVPGEGEDRPWVYSVWNGKYVPTHAIVCADAAHRDKLLHGFSIEPRVVWAGSISRVLLRPRGEPRHIVMRGWVPDIDAYPNRINDISICVDDKAVGDRVLHRQSIERAGSFEARAAVPIELRRRRDEMLVTMRGTRLRAAAGDVRDLSFVIESVAIVED